MRHLWSGFLVVSAHQSEQKHFSTSCGSKRQDSECLNPRASICHDSPQQPLPPAPCPVHFHISLKIQARRHSRKTCVVAGHLTLPPPTCGELGQARHEPQTLSRLWHRSGWWAASSTSTSPAIWVPLWSRFFPGGRRDLQVRGNPSTSFPREKQAEIQISECLRASPWSKQDQIVHFLVPFLALIPNPHSNQAWPGLPNLWWPANEKYSWHILSQFYLTITACGREERKGEGRNERIEDSKEGNGGWERKQRREGGKWEYMLKTLPAQQPQIKPALVLKRLSLDVMRLFVAVDNSNRAIFSGVGLWLVSLLTEYVQNFQTIFLSWK